MRKKVLIFIHKSLGELDWIAPFIKSEEAETLDFFVYLNKMGSSYEDKKDILDKYGLDKENVTLLNNKNYSKKLYKLIDRRLIKLKKKVDFFKPLAKYFRLKNVKELGYEEDYDFIFRECQLRYAFELSCFLRANRKAKVVAFPHAVSIPKRNAGFIVYGHPPRVKIDLWLENCTLAYQWMPDVFYATGAPGLSSFYDLEGLFNPSSCNVLVNTRNEFDLHGCTKEAVLERFDQILSYCERKGLTAHIKHHPRDHELYLYRDIQKKYSCAVEYTGTLTNISMEFRACLSFFSTSGLFLTARKVPVFDITPYVTLNEFKSKPSSVNSLHYGDKQGRLTNDLMEIGVQERLVDLDDVFIAEVLTSLSKKQFDSLIKHFPANSNNLIYNKLEELSN
ncbi:MAG: hypothetical protein HFP81_10355 [Methylococcales symbiont of Hymedesmia sp. n. MRB-2018]|nr:MAG: hypothetical protein HFP81_10355 [Methylococcales symbiont of Hymedesmia sp. n. MRB-2018]